MNEHDEQDENEKVDLFEFLKQYESERLAQIDTAFQNSAQHRERSAQMEGLFGQLEGALPEDMKEVLREYADLTVDELSDGEQFAFREGIIEVVRAVWWLLRNGKRLGIW